MGRFKKDGDTEAATRIAGLKKPSVSAWVVNQLARSNEVDLQRLIKAGESLEQAQRDAISGAASGGFESVRRDEAAAVRLLRTSAKQVLPSASPTILDRVTNTLRAAAASPEGRLLIKQGRLTEDLEAQGFETLSGQAAPKPVEKPASRSAGGKEKQLQGKIETLRKRKREADEDADRRADEARKLERDALDAEALATRTTRAAEAARRRADAAALKAKSLGAELTELEDRA